MKLENVDFMLYLVYQRESVRPGSRDALRSALEGGVTLVQLREKTASTADFLAVAQECKVLCDEFGVPLIINDRIDIALAVKAAGVHIGQDDMPCLLARRLLGSEAIIGVSANNDEQALKAIADGADYLGIGPCYETISKADAKGTLGPRGVARILDTIERSEKSIRAVSIGGINASNIRRVLHGSVSTKGRALDGVAVISGILAAADVKAAASRLRQQVEMTRTAERNPTPFEFDFGPLFDKVKQSHALIQQITNTVVQNDSANATLALGCSPIMSANAEEAEDLSNVLSCLLINLGTLTPAQVEAMQVASKAANQRRKPIVFDPVGVGASTLRRQTTDHLLNHAQMSVIKGNAAEICALAGVRDVASRGVDSEEGARPNPAIARALARRERCIVAMTGAVDVISDGSRLIECHNGHPLLGSITGSGCMTGSAIACFAASAAQYGVDTGGCVEGDMLLATAAGITAVNVAAEIAAARVDVQGPNTFRAALIDSLYNLSREDVRERARIETVER